MGAADCNKQKHVMKSSQSSSEKREDDQFDCEEQTKLARGKGKRKAWRYQQLTEYHSLPAFLRDNEFILGYYRSEWPLKQALLSIFTIHNETLNVWTHLIGFFLFLSLTIYTANKVPSIVDLHSMQNLPELLKKADMHTIRTMVAKCLPSLSNMPGFHKLRDELRESIKSVNSVSSLSGWHVLQILKNCLPDQISTVNRTDAYFSTAKDHLANIVASLSFETQPITRWPFFVFMGGAMFCLLASSACHLLCCHSERLSYIMLRFDYAGIAALIATSFYPPVYYSFMCNPFFLYLYLTVITLLGIATIAFSLFPVFQHPEFRSIRAGLFFGMGFSGAAPILHKLFLHWNQPEALQTTCYELLMGALYGSGALIYAMRIPERWRPGKFDIAGHSHQLFHVLVVAGAYTHYCDGLVYLNWRDRHGC